MKKNIIFFFVLCTLIFSGCAKTGTTSEEIDYVEVISESCGHKCKNDVELSYNLVLAAMNSQNNVSWESYDFSDLKHSECTEVLSEATVDLTDDLEYALCKVKQNDGSILRLVFAYDPSLKKVVACFDDDYDLYFQTWDTYEKIYRYYYCGCD